MGFPICETGDVSHEDPRQRVHGNTTTLNNKLGSRGDELAVQHSAADENPHKHEQQHEENIHEVSEEAVITAGMLQEPASLEEGVRDLAAEQHGATLDTRLAQPQG